MGEKKKKRYGDRKDGKWLRDLDVLHAFTPYMFPDRCDNEAFICERIDLTNINRYLGEKNLAKPDFEYKLFQIIVAALAKTIVLRPRMNRFVKGNRMYQRDKLTVSFVVKKEFKDSSEEALAFLELEETTNLEDIRQKISAEIHTCREGEIDNSTAGMDSLTKLPRPILRFVMWILFKLDYYGKVPDFLAKTDPNHATVFLSNLGSIGLKSGYHHLTNWGTTSIFVVIGEKKIIDGKETVDIGLTLDERIADGYYYSKTVKLLKYLLQNPEKLEDPAEEEVDYERF